MLGRRINTDKFRQDLSGADTVAFDPPPPIPKFPDVVPAEAVSKAVPNEETPPAPPPTILTRRLFRAILENDAARGSAGVRGADAVNARSSGQAVSIGLFNNNALFI